MLEQLLQDMARDMNKPVVLTRYHNENESNFWNSQKQGHSPENTGKLWNICLPLGIDYK